MKPRFRGIFIPTLTTFHDDGEVDFDVLAEMLEFNIDAGVHGLFVLGSTGMGPAMTTEQRLSTAEFVMERVRGRLPVIMHAGAADVQTTCRLAQHSQGLGVDAVAVVPPYYYTDHTPWEITAHYKAVAAAVNGTPLFLYDNVKYSGWAFTPATAKALQQEVPSLCGMKASYYGQGPLMGYLEAMPEDFAVMSGNSIDLLPATPHGLSGAIPPLTSAIPEICVALWDALERRDYERAIPLQKKADDFGRAIGRLGQRFGRGAHREAMRARGFRIKRYPRWPSEELTEEAMQTVADALKATGV